MSGLTKIFIVLQLVFSVAVSVLLVLMVSRQENYKSRVDAGETARIAQFATITADQEKIAMLNATIADKDKALQAQIAEAQKSSTDAGAKYAANQSSLLQAEAEKARLGTQLTSLTNTVETLKNLLQQKDKDLDTLRPQVADLINHNADLNRANNEANTGLHAAEQAIRTLKEEVAFLQENTKTGAGLPGETGGQVMTATNQTNVQVNGTVVETLPSAGHLLIQTGLGSRDGVRENTRFMIYRDHKYVADAVVKTVYPDASVAIVTTTKQGEAVQKGDIVESGGQ